MPPKSPPLAGSLRPPSPPAYQPPPQVYPGGGIPPPPSQTLTHPHRPHQQQAPNPGAPVYVSPLGPTSMTQPSPSSSPYSTAARQHPQTAPIPQPRGNMVAAGVAYPSSPTTAELWSGTRPAPQGQLQHASSKPNLRPGSGGSAAGPAPNRPLGVIPPLSASTTASSSNLPTGGMMVANPERPHSNTSLSSSDSGPGSTFSSSRSSSRDPLPAVSSAAFPSSSSTPPSAVFYNGQPPTSKPPYGKEKKKM